MRPVGAGLIVSRPQHRETPAGTRLLALAGRELSGMAPIAPRLPRALRTPGDSAALPSAHPHRDPRRVSQRWQRSPRAAASPSRVIPAPPTPGRPRHRLPSVPPAAQLGSPRHRLRTSPSAAPGSPRNRS